jgi:hypothetical protein
MAKPSITNIRPPSKSPEPIWTPPKTSWDLNVAADVTAAGAFYGDHSSPAEQAEFTSLTNSINTTEKSERDDVTAADMQGGSAEAGWNYDYVFFGVNGGEDETVVGNTGASGIIVTGNGKDNITGGNKGDLVYAGNGKDVVHGKGGNDIIFGENGADELHGDSDNGTAAVTTTTGGVVIKSTYQDGGENDLLTSLPANGSSTAPGTGDNGVRKEGVFIALDADGHPTGTDNDPNGNPYVHTVWSFTPDDGDGTAGETIDYTIAYYRSNVLDGPGDPTPDYFQVSLTEGSKYFFSFTNYDGNLTGQNLVRIFLTDDLNGNPPPSPLTGQSVDPIETSQAMPTHDWSTYFDVTTGGTELTDFTAGDELIGGNGPDQFFWSLSDDHNVDLIWDYNQGDGTYNPLEGDKVVLDGVLAALTDTNDDDVIDKFDLTTFADVDLDGDDSTGLVIYVSANHAIGLVGINDISQVDVLLG